MKLKICGLREKENIERISALEPDYIGLIFYRKSPRYAGDLLRPEDLDRVSDAIKKVGVFVNENIELLIDTVKKFKLDAVQLHGSETLDYCRSLKDENIEIIKAFFPESDTDFKLMKNYKGLCDYFLFDKRDSKGGGSGKKFNWEALKGYDMEKPYFLSGGIGPDDAGLISQIADKYLHAIDINSRFEIKPGLKDAGLVSEFINELKKRK
ncbi:MAG: phosphoribosylanthranilate isomerase [Bacteroidales bacterium]|nr:phosphoribosylanthranilate isomerase [Bacteroidales bacterium]